MLASVSGGTDKSGNYVIFFPPKRHAMIATQFAFGDQLVQLTQYLMGLTTSATSSTSVHDAATNCVVCRYTGVYRKKFTFYADFRDMNFIAADSIIKGLTTVYNVTLNSHTFPSPHTVLISIH